jgi:hyaluronoglucosaminidase
MIRKLIHLLPFCTFILIVQSLHAQQIHPEPQQVSSEGRYMALPQRLDIRLDMENSTTKNSILSGFSDNIKKGSGRTCQVIMGRRGDKLVKSYDRLIPNKADGYYLMVKPGHIVIAGYDDRGLFYGYQTLRQMVHNDSILIATIVDYPDVPYRGVVEGFYGVPWSYEARMRQLDFYGKNKLNTYIYGPKDDPYHSTPHWRDPYPEKEAKMLKNLVDKAHANCVDFVWAIHPGRDIKWNVEDRTHLLNKFESMYQLGVRSFAVFFDDISGDGTDPKRQAQLLNYINKNFVNVKKDINQLIICPTEYNKAWSDVKDGYLPTLGDSLDPSIQIMWTGDKVISCIDKPTMNWINPILKRKAYIWWNFPVSDYVRDHLLVGPVYGNGLDIKDDVAAFVSNPMERAEASKVALYSVADYTWNMHTYNSEQSWKNALADILPLSSNAFQEFANHCSDLGQNGHGFRRDESVDLQPSLKHLLASYGEDKLALDTVRTTCERIIRSADILMADKENPYLIDEIKPWLQQAKLVGQYGLSVLAMQGYTLDKDGTASAKFLDQYFHAHALQTLMYELDAASNQNPYQPGVKYGSKVLMPTLNELYSIATANFNHLEGTCLDTIAQYMPYKWESDVPQIAHQPLQLRRNELQVSPSNEVINWPSNGYIKISSDIVRNLIRVSLDFGTKNIAHAFTCEVSVDGKQWLPLQIKQNDEKTELEIDIPANTNVRDICIKNVSGKNMQVYFKRMLSTWK